MQRIVDKLRKSSLMCQDCGTIDPEHKWPENIKRFIVSDLSSITKIYICDRKLKKFHGRLYEKVIICEGHSMMNGLPF